MPGRGPQSFKKRQKEQQRKEKHEAKLAKRHARHDTTEHVEDEAPGDREEQPGPEPAAE